MFIEENMFVRAVDKHDNTYTGTICKIVVQPCKDDDNQPHALIFISQDKKYINSEGDFGCISLWVDKLKSLETIPDNSIKLITYAEKNRRNNRI